MEGDSATTTPLNQLPKNDKNDSDLVNKILTQLEEVPKDDIEHVEEIEIPIKKQYVKPKKIVSVEEHVSDDETLENYNNNSGVVGGIEDSLPSPDTIKGLYNSIDMDKIYNSLKLAAMYSIIFLLFLHFQNNFRVIFEKIPYVKNYIGFVGEINNTYKMLLSLLFGIIVFSLDIFYIKS